MAHDLRCILSVVVCDKQVKLVIVSVYIALYGFTRALPTVVDHSVSQALRAQ